MDPQPGDLQKTSTQAEDENIHITGKWLLLSRSIVYKPLRTITQSEVPSSCQVPSLSPPPVSSKSFSWWPPSCWCPNTRSTVLTINLQSYYICDYPPPLELAAICCVLVSPSFQSKWLQWILQFRRELCLKEPSEWIIKFGQMHLNQEQSGVPPSMGRQKIPPVHHSTNISWHTIQTQSRAKAPPAASPVWLWDWMLF